MSPVLSLSDFAPAAPECDRAVLPSPWPPGAVAVFLIGTSDRPWLVDAGPGTAESVSALRGALDRRAGLAPLPSGVILTHSHLDHAGGLGALRPQIVIAHRDAATAYEADARAAPLHPFETVTGEGGDLERLPPWEWIRAGGHAPGHLMPWNPETGVLIGGDQFLLGLKTPLRVADPAEDSFGAYLESLSRVAELEPAIILTSHTPAIEQPAGWLDRERARLCRQLDRALAAVRSGARTAETVMERTYGALPAAGARELLLREKLAALRHLAAGGAIRRALEDDLEVFDA